MERRDTTRVKTGWLKRSRKFLIPIAGGVVVWGSVGVALIIVIRTWNPDPPQIQNPDSDNDKPTAAFEAEGGARITDNKFQDPHHKHRLLDENGEVVFYTNEDSTELTPARLIYIMNQDGVPVAACHPDGCVTITPTETY